MKKGLEIGRVNNNTSQVWKTLIKARAVQVRTNSKLRAMGNNQMVEWGGGGGGGWWRGGGKS